MTDRYILTLSCPDAPNIVATVTRFLAENGGFITESAQFGDPSTDTFFMRTEFTLADDGDACQTTNYHEVIHQRFTALAMAYNMTWQLHNCAKKPRVLIAVTTASHCLGTILNRVESGSLDVDIVGVVSNHENLRGLTERNGLEFHYLPVTPDTKPAQEAKILALMDSTQADVLVLARYMQILSDDMSQQLAGRAINIHHSFLPGFKGANPYKQAYARGVKIIGATAHYVSAELDEGPIIEQEVIRVSHHHTPDTLKNFGQDIESQVLLRALTYHCEHRVLLNGNKTVVFV